MTEQPLMLARSARRSTLTAQELNGIFEEIAKEFTKLKGEGRTRRGQKGRRKALPGQAVPYQDQQPRKEESDAVEATVAVTPRFFHVEASEDQFEDQSRGKYKRLGFPGRKSHFQPSGSSISAAFRTHKEGAIPTLHHSSRPRSRGTQSYKPQSMSSDLDETDTLDSLPHTTGGPSDQALPSILKNRPYSPRPVASNVTGANVDATEFMSVYSQKYSVRLPDTAAATYCVEAGSQGYPEPVSYNFNSENELTRLDNREKVDREAATFFEGTLRGDLAEVRDKVVAVEAIVSCNDGNTTSEQWKKIISLLDETMSMSTSECNPLKPPSQTSGHVN